MSRNNNRFSQINGSDMGSRYARRHPERLDSKGIPGTLQKMQSRIFQTQKISKRHK